MAPIPDNARIIRERRTVTHMVEIFCRDRHGSAYMLCPQCAELQEYAMARLDHCVYKADKPTCKYCPVHCYKKDMRERMREVMIHSGPRMLWEHPVLAIRHLLDERKTVPPHPSNNHPVTPGP